MDSKLRTATIVTVVLLMLTIFGVVILMNIDVPNTAQTSPVSGQSEMVVEVQKEKDLSAFMWDDMFFDDKPKTKGNKMV